MALLSLPPCPDGAVARCQPMLEPPIQREVYTLTTWSAQPDDGNGAADGADGAPAPAKKKRGKAELRAQLGLAALLLRGRRRAVRAVGGSVAVVGLRRPRGERVDLSLDGRLQHGLTSRHRAVGARREREERHAGRGARRRGLVARPFAAATKPRFAHLGRSRRCGSWRRRTAARSLACLSKTQTTTMKGKRLFTPTQVSNRLFSQPPRSPPLSSVAR